MSSILGAISLIGSGVGSGYRASEALQRELAEARRKALLEEREQVVKEKSAATEELYRKSQEAQLGAETQGMQFDLGEKKRAALRGQESSVPGGIHLDTPGGQINRPGSVEDVSDIESLLKEIMGNQSATNVARFGASGREPSDTELGIKGVLDVLGPPDKLELLKPAERAAAYEERRNFFESNLQRFTDAVAKTRGKKSAALGKGKPKSKGDPLGIR